MKKGMMIVVALAAMATVASLAVWSGGMEPAVPAVAASSAGPFMANLRESLAAHRKIIMLFADEKMLSENECAQAHQVGQSLFHENHWRVVEQSPT